MKNKFVAFLVWCLWKIDPKCQITKQYIYEDKLEVGFKKYMPKDNDWHYVGLVFGAWVKAGNGIEVEVKGKETQMTMDNAYVTESEAGEKK